MHKGKVELQIQSNTGDEGQIWRTWPYDQSCRSLSRILEVKGWISSLGDDSQSLTYYFCVISACGFVSFNRLSKSTLFPFWKTLLCFYKCCLQPLGIIDQAEELHITILIKQKCA